VTALLKALPLSLALTIIISLNLSPYGPYAVFLHVVPATFSFFGFYWSWPIFAVLTLLGWIFFWLLEIR